MDAWKTLKKEFLIDEPWLKVAKETCELSTGIVIDDFYTLWQPEWVLILAQNEEENWIFVKQYRHGTGKVEMEFPAGILNKNEAPEEAAVRELREECGYIPSEKTQIKFIGTMPVNTDRHRGKFHIVYLNGVQKKAETSFDETEEIETFTLSDFEVNENILNGAFYHPLQIAGYYKWKLGNR